MDSQKQEIREAVELPLTQFDLYKEIGIDPREFLRCHCQSVRDKVSHNKDQGLSFIEQ